jgi:hypothetical protein
MNPIRALHKDFLTMSAMEMIERALLANICAVVLIMGREQPRNPELEDIPPFFTDEGVVLKRLKERSRRVAGIAAEIEAGVVEIRNGTVAEARGERNELVVRLHKAPGDREEAEQRNERVPAPRAHQPSREARKACGHANVRPTDNARELRDEPRMNTWRAFRIRVKKLIDVAASD